MTLFVVDAVSLSSLFKFFLRKLTGDRVFLILKPARFEIFGFSDIQGNVCVSAQKKDKNVPKTKIYVNF
jgi:hypothetical protein